MGVFETLGMVYGVVLIVYALFLFAPKIYRKILSNYFQNKENNMFFFLLIFLSLISLYSILKNVPVLYALVIFLSVAILYWSMIYLFIPQLKNAVIALLLKEDDFFIRMMGLLIFSLGAVVLFLSLV